MLRTVPTTKMLPKYVVPALAATAGGLIAYGAVAKQPFSTTAYTNTATGNRVYVSIRRASELEPLLILKPTLLANFVIYTDPLSKHFSDTLKDVVANKTSNQQVSLVDIESDEPDVRDLLPRYMVSKIPTVVALRGGLPIDKYVVKGSEIDQQDLQAWVDKVGVDK